jgi:UDP-N-acetylmuramate dehydrogenase
MTKKMFPPKDWQKNVLLASLTTFGIGGPAEFFAIVHSNKELIKNIIIAKQHKLKFFILGGGSNVLIADSGWSGLAIKNEVRDITANNSKVSACSGVKLANLVFFASQNGLTGLECCRGIPGTIGGAIIGNAGAKDNWISQSLEQVTVIDKNNKIKNLSKQECRFGYRTSRFQNSQEIILKAVFKLQPDSIAKIADREKSFLELRKGQPQEKSAGSVFKNPTSKPAGWLIEKAGLKGKKIGGAKISNKHANFIINNHQAKAKDVLSLIKLAQEKVLKQFNIQLRPEIKLIGFAKSEIADII